MSRAARDTNSSVNIMICCRYIYHNNCLDDKLAGHNISPCVLFETMVTYSQTFIHGILFLPRRKQPLMHSCNGPSDSCYFYPSSCFCKSLDSCREHGEGSARQPAMLRLPIHDIILAVMYLGWPCPQHGSSSWIKQHAMSNQTTGCWLTMHAGFTRQAATSRRIFDWEGMNILFCLSFKGIVLMWHLA